MHNIHILDKFRISEIGRDQKSKLYDLHSLIINDEASPLEKWKSWIIKVTFSIPKTKKLLNLISVLSFTSLFLIIILQILLKSYS